MGSNPIKVPNKVESTVFCCFFFFFFGTLDVALEKVCLSNHLSTYPQILLISWGRRYSPLSLSEEEVEILGSGVTFRKDWI